MSRVEKNEALGNFSELFGKIPSWIWSLSFISYLSMTAMFIYGSFFYRPSYEFQGKMIYIPSSKLVSFRIDGNILEKFPIAKGGDVEILLRNEEETQWESTIQSVVFIPEERVSRIGLGSRPLSGDRKPIVEISSKRSCVIKIYHKTLYQSIFRKKIKI